LARQVSFHSVQSWLSTVKGTQRLQSPIRLTRNDCVRITICEARKQPKKFGCDKRQVTSENKYPFAITVRERSVKSAPCSETGPRIEHYRMAESNELIVLKLFGVSSDKSDPRGFQRSLRDTSGSTGKHLAVEFDKRLIRAKSTRSAPDKDVSVDV